MTVALTLPAHCALATLTCWLSSFSVSHSLNDNWLCTKKEVFKASATCFYQLSAVADVTHPARAAKDVSSNLLLHTEEKALN